MPEGLADETVAAILFKGLTAEYLTRRRVSLAAGDAVLLHAAAGGVGILANQWLKALRVTVIGTVGTQAKAGIARAHGCDHVILYTQDDFHARVMQITEGKGVRVVSDPVGADTFARSLGCLQPRGTLVSHGESSGPVPPVQVAALADIGVGRPAAVTHVAVAARVGLRGRDSAGPSGRHGNRPAPRAKGFAACAGKCGAMYLKIPVRRRF